MILSQLISANIPSPKLEARMIEAYAKKHNLSPEQISQIVQERINHKPLDKILGERGFYKYNFKVTEDVLTPRPDTEILVEEAIRIIHQQQITILDLGTGSGCILLSILKDCPNTTGVGLDISPKALQIADQNAETLNLSNRVSFVHANWFEFSCDQLFTDQKFDLIVSNPPYIPSNDISTLDPEVKDHDPMLALDGGDDGLNSYRKIAQLAPLLLKQKGYILLEAGIDQTPDIENIFASHGLTHLKTIPDLAGIPRCVVFQK